MKNTVQNCLIVLLLLGTIIGCSGTRVHRLTDFQYLPKAADASIELFVGKLQRPYEPIALIDSRQYQSKDNVTKEHMLEDLRNQARNLGGDCVQAIRLLPVKVRGVVADLQVPVHGAWTQGRTTRYFLRGEVIHYVEEMGEVPSLFSKQPELTINDDETPQEQIRQPSIAEPEEPALPATPQNLRVPEIAED